MLSEQNWQQVQILTNPQFVPTPSSPKHNVKQAHLQIRQEKEPLHPQSQKSNPMQLSKPISELTSVSTTTQLQQQLTLKQLDNKYQTYEKQTCSNLQALRNLPRKITKNNHIKIQCKTEFPLVRAVAVGEFGWTLMSKENHKQLVDIIWTDTYVTEELVKRLRPYQKVNHFPYSTQMGRKDYLFANLNKMRSKHKEQYDYFAKTWIFPQDYQRFKEETQTETPQNDNSFYIAKPVASCQGKGIFLAKRNQILAHTSSHKLLVQQYIQNTLLIDGLKFDTRIYVLIKSLQPLSIYIYKQGLTRLATTPYQAPNESNYRNGRMHLTNYAINKNNPNFVHNKDFRKDNVGHKRSLASLFQEVQKMGGNVNQVKRKIEQIVVKTVLAVYEKMTVLERVQNKIPAMRDSIKNISIVETNQDGLFAREKKKTLAQSFLQTQFTIPPTSQKCFQLLGFDIMLTDKFQPKLIQINHQPSLTASSPLDYIIKKSLLIDVFSLLNIDSREKEMHLMGQRDVEGQGFARGFQIKGARKQITINGWTSKNNDNHAEIQLGGFSCIYPVPNSSLMNLYHKLMPMLLIHQQPQQTRSKKRNQSFSFHKSQHNIIGQNFPFRENKTSLGKTRKEYTCNYINMLGMEKVGEGGMKKEDGEEDNNGVILEASVKGEEESNEKEGNKKTQGSSRDHYAMGSRVTPRVKMGKTTHYELAKKNLNFTIKHIKTPTSTNKATHIQPTQSPQTNQNNPSQSQPLQPSPVQQVSTKITSLSFHTHKLTLSKTPKNFHNKPQHINDHSNNIIKESLPTEPRHSSHDTRIGIKLIKEKQDAIGRIEIVTRGIGTASEMSRRQTISLQKYSYPIYEKNSQTTSVTPDPSIVSPYYQSVTPSPSKPESRSMRRNAEYFDKVYEKQLIIRINKMKSMKDKLQKLKKNSSKTEHEIAISKEQFRINNSIIKNGDSHKNIVPKEGRIQSTQLNHFVEPQSIIKQDLEKHLPFQTIKLLQFQQPQVRKVSHNHTEKNHHQSKDKFNNSMEMFKDEAFVNSHRKNTFYNLKVKDSAQKEDQNKV